MMHVSGQLVKKQGQSYRWSSAPVVRCGSNHERAWLQDQSGVEAPGSDSTRRGGQVLALHQVILVESLVLSVSWAFPGIRPEHRVRNNPECLQIWPILTPHPSKKQVLQSHILLVPLAQDRYHQCLVMLHKWTFFPMRRSVEHQCGNKLPTSHSLTTILGMGERKLLSFCQCRKV